MGRLGVVCELPSDSLDRVLNPPRKRMRRCDVPGSGRYLTFSCYRRLRLIDNDAIKARFVAHLGITLSRYEGVHLLAWVVMPEHVHLILFPQEDRPLTPFLTALKRPLAMEVLARWRALDAPVLPRLCGRDGQTRFWQPGGGYDRNIVTELREKIRYVHCNPVARRLADAPTDWPWSSARAMPACPQPQACRSHLISYRLRPRICFDRGLHGAWHGTGYRTVAPGCFQTVPWRGSLPACGGTVCTIGGCSSHWASRTMDGASGVMLNLKRCSPRSWMGMRWAAALGGTVSQAKGAERAMVARVALSLESKL